MVREVNMLAMMYIYTPKILQSSGGFVPISNGE